MRQKKTDKQRQRGLWETVIEIDGERRGAQSKKQNCDDVNIERERERERRKEGTGTGKE